MRAHAAPIVSSTKPWVQDVPRGWKRNYVPRATHYPIWGFLTTFVGTAELLLATTTVLLRLALSVTAYFERDSSAALRVDHRLITPGLALLTPCIRETAYYGIVPVLYHTPIRRLLTCNINYKLDVRCLVDLEISTPGIINDPLNA
jgi:hypothetical protein